jgi:hypothetical protein
LKGELTTMPFPITPIGDINSFDNIFDSRPDDDVATAGKYFSKEPDNTDSIKLLEIIDKYQDNIVSAAANIVSGNGEKYYNVPESINDNLLLKLKGEGYCVGYGRTVRFSDKARSALKKRYLGSENSYLKSRVKKKII